MSAFTTETSASVVPVESDPPIPADADQPEPPFAVVRGTVESVELVSPSFVRVVFGGAEIDAIGNPGETFDQRIKLIFPPESGQLPDLSRSGDDWYQDWLAIPNEERGAMRTYSVRDITVEGGRTRLVIDFVLHLVPGETGPASTWASSASVGDELLLVAPRRGRFDGGGIEYAPGETDGVLLAGDETAAPAIARILEDSPAGLRGTAFIEVPEHGDRLEIEAPAGVEVHWLPRSGAGTGTVLIPAVLEHLAASSGSALSGAADERGFEIRDVETESLLWETPVYSGLGEAIEEGGDRTGSYFWIAGESGTVTTLRRRLVAGLGIDRSRVAFMGYWRRGVAMKG